MENEIREIDFEYVVLNRGEETEQPVVWITTRYEDRQFGSLVTEDVIDHPLVDYRRGSNAAYIALHELPCPLKRGMVLRFSDGVDCFSEWIVGRPRTHVEAITHISYMLHMMVAVWRSFTLDTNSLSLSISQDGAGENLFVAYANDLDQPTRLDDPTFRSLVISAGS